MLNPELDLAILTLVESWFRSAARELPWRENRSPYRVWVSEIMLQQTQVSTVIDYFNRFMARFETIDQLANAPEDEVLSYWTGLGYYSRCRNLHAAAKKIASDHSGNFPESFDKISSLPGVGSYTAGAIYSFAFNQVAPVVDGNIARVLSRIYSDSTPIDTPKGKKHFESLSLKFAEASGDPACFHEGLMELGATVCRPKAPLCELCPIATHCQSLRSGNALSLPVKSKKAAKKELHAVFAIIGDEHQVWLERNEESRLFKKLYAPPHVVIGDPDSTRDALTKLSEQFGFPLPNYPLKKITLIRHLTHRIFHMHAYQIPRSSIGAAKAKFVKIDDFSKIGISSAILALLQRASLLALSLFLIPGCSHKFKGVRKSSTVQKVSAASKSQKVGNSEKLEEWRSKVVSIANEVIGKRQIVFNGSHFRRDCSGTVRGIFEMAGVSLKKATGAKRQTDSKTLFDYVGRIGITSSDAEPEIGDLVFFHNTYDVNRDRKLNDEFSHVGVVTDVLSDGSVLFVHYSNGVVIKKSSMDDMLRARRRGFKSRTGKELFAGYGKIDIDLWVKDYT